MLMEVCRGGGERERGMRMSEAMNREIWKQ
jgi:hypothetical protein